MAVDPESTLLCDGDGISEISTRRNTANELDEMLMMNIFQYSVISTYHSVTPTGPS